MSLRTGNADRLKCVFFVDRIGDVPDLDSMPIDNLVIEIDGLGLGETRCRVRLGGAGQIATHGTGCW